MQAYFWLSVSALGSFSQTLTQADPSKLNSRALEQLAELDDPAVLRELLARSMRAEDIVEAQRLVRDWRPSHQVGPPAAISLVASENRQATSGTGSAQGKLTKKSTGTIFVLNKEGYAVTNNHVVSECRELRIEGRDEIVKILIKDTVNDLALVQIPGDFKVSAAIISDPSKLRQGEDIVVFGFPLNSLLSSGGNLTPGVVSALSGLGNNTNQIQITAPIQPGSSGSPVLNKKGEVVGVVSMKLSDSQMAKATGQVAQTVNFGVNAQTLKTFLGNQKVEYRDGVGMFSREKNAADLADEARKWTVVIECWN